MIIRIVCVLVLLGVGESVTNTCQECKTINCTSNLCYRLSGSGFENQEICSNDTCKIGESIELNGVECSINSNSVLCSSKCCVSKTRSSYQDSYCAELVPNGWRYCQGQMSNAAVGGIILGTLLGLVGLGVGICCVVSYMKRKNQKEQQKTNDKEQAITEGGSDKLEKKSTKVKRRKSNIKKSKIEQVKDQQANRTQSSPNKQLQDGSQQILAESGNQIDKTQPMQVQSNLQQP